MPASRSWLEAALAPHGLRLRGGWIPTASDALPALPEVPVAVVWMIGQVGSECWQPFTRSPFFADGLPNPMDRWSQSIGDALARRWRGRAIYPSDGPPYAPFQGWAARAEPLEPSALMLQMHPQYGLWHALRFALLLPELAPEDATALVAAAGTRALAAGPTGSAEPTLAVGPPESTARLADLCVRCSGKPCLHACPVDAFQIGGYAVDGCAAHLHGPSGGDCMQGGCLARRACPVGVEHRYAPAHAAFHMTAFARHHPGGP